MARSYGVGITTFRAWSTVDRDLALALQIHEDGLCSRCGQPLDECADPDSSGAYTVPDPVRCHACTAKAEKAENYTESRHPSALMFPVVLKPGVERSYSVES